MVMTATEAPSTSGVDRSGFGKSMSGFYAHDDADPIAGVNGISCFEKPWNVRLPLSRHRVK